LTDMANKTSVHLERSGRIGYLVLDSGVEDHPPTLDIGVLEQLREVARKATADPESFRALVVRSTSPKYFAVGADLEALRAADSRSIMDWVQRGNAVFAEIENLPMPVIARVEGYALGGGLELALTCDMIAATRDSLFGFPEAGLGFIPGWGGSFRLPVRIGLSRARELFYTARIIGADEALAIGLIGFAGTRDQLDRYLTETYGQILKNSRVALRMIKAVSAFALPIDRALLAQQEAAASSVCLSHGDTRRRLEEFFEQRKERRKAK